ncbi:unnamed protein product [Hydatigera taeniaeformis]|uniref:Uncharacterized protein n=1 Tax=Hydatigena taeniaeformis TaxID=6205 RepID=A0A0R3XD19_HYDTA|nr:unnamed protein product [Hydatigera taeniaeformis]
MQTHLLTGLSSAHQSPASLSAEGHWELGKVLRNGLNPSLQFHPDTPTPPKPRVVNVRRACECDKFTTRGPTYLPTYLDDCAGRKGTSSKLHLLLIACDAYCHLPWHQPNNHLPNRVDRWADD